MSDGGCCHYCRSYTCRCDLLAARAEAAEYRRERDEARHDRDTAQAEVERLLQEVCGLEGAEQRARWAAETSGQALRQRDAARAEVAEAHAALAAWLAATEDVPTIYAARRTESRRILGGAS